MTEYSGEDVEGRVRALTALHQEKTKALMKSIDSLKSQVRSLQASQKEHRRSGLIRALQRQVREQELAADVLKQYITDSTSISRRQVDDMLIKKTVGGPLRFRPKTREELGREVESLQKELATAKATIRRFRAAPSHPRKASSPRPSETGPALPPIRSTPSGTEGSQRGTTAAPARERGLAGAGRVASLLTRIDEMASELDARDAVLEDLREQFEASEEEVARLRTVEDRARHLSVKYAHAQERLEALREEVQASAGQQSRSEEKSQREAAARATLQEQLSAAHQQLQDVEERHAQEMANMADQKLRLVQEKEALRERIYSLTETAERGRQDFVRQVQDSGKVVSERSQLEQQLRQESEARAAASQREQTARDEAQEMQSRVREMEHREELLQERIGELKEDRDSLRRMLAELQSKMSDTASRQAAGLERSNSFQFQLHRQSEEADSLRQRLEATQKECDKWRVSHQSISDQLRAAKDLYRKESRVAAALRAQLADAKVAANSSTKPDEEEDARDRAGASSESAARPSSSTVEEEPALAAASPSYEMDRPALSRQVRELETLWQQAVQDAQSARSLAQNALNDVQSDVAFLRAAAAEVQRWRGDEGQPAPAGTVVLHSQEEAVPDGGLPAAHGLPALALLPSSVAAAERVLKAWQAGWAARRTAVMARLEDVEREALRSRKRLRAMEECLEAAQHAVQLWNRHSSGLEEKMRRDGAVVPPRPSDLSDWEQRMTLPPLAVIDQRPDH